MAMRGKKKKEEQVVEFQEINVQIMRFNVVGTSPMIMNRFSQKAWHELLFPSARENRAGLEQTLKHDPMSEYQGALYLNRAPGKALVHVPNRMFHCALAGAALDIPGTTKAKIERLTQVIDINIEFFGIPQIFCAMVRNSDINRTPDVRTRPIFPQWACSVNVQYARPMLAERAIANLMGAAGVIVGIGDWRPQKGGPYGRFRLADDKDEEFRSIVKLQGRKAQEAAFAAPSYFDSDTEELLTWFNEEVHRREMNHQLGRGTRQERKAAPKTAVHVVAGGDGRGRDEDFVAVE